MTGTPNFRNPMLTLQLHTLSCDQQRLRREGSGVGFMHSPTHQMLTFLLCFKSSVDDTGEIR